MTTTNTVIQQLEELLDYHISEGGSVQGLLAHGLEGKEELEQSYAERLQDYFWIHDTYLPKLTILVNGILECTKVLQEVEGDEEVKPTAEAMWVDYDHTVERMVKDDEIPLDPKDYLHEFITIYTPPTKEEARKFLSKYHFPNEIEEILDTILWEEDRKIKEPTQTVTITADQAGGFWQALMTEVDTIQEQHEDADNWAERQYHVIRMEQLRELGLILIEAFPDRLSGVGELNRIFKLG